MNITIHSAKLELTPAIKKYIEIKMLSLGHLITRFEKGGALLINFEISRTTKHHKHGEVYYAEANLKIAKDLLRAEAYHADARGAVDLVKDILRKEIGNYKELKNPKEKIHRTRKITLK